MDRDSAPTSYRQTTMVPPNVWEVRLRIGGVEEEDHAQVQVEAVDPSTNELLALRSMPHISLLDQRKLLRLASQMLQEVVEELREPFPG